MNLIHKKMEKLVLATYFTLILSPKLHAVRAGGIMPSETCYTPSRRHLEACIVVLIGIFTMRKEIVRFIKRRIAQIKGEQFDKSADIGFLLLVLLCVFLVCISLFCPNDASCKFH